MKYYNYIYEDNTQATIDKLPTELLLEILQKGLRGELQIVDDEGIPNLTILDVIEQVRLELLCRELGLCMESL